ncbi:MAG: alanine racemase [Chloroflexi bacterium]|nr:alanine racemase [Chloroflexota bacterium]
MVYLEDILKATAGRTFGEVFHREFDGFSYDSRKLRPGELFLAVRTGKADGHDYILEACRAGAAAVLSEREIDLSAFGATCVVVEDTRQALKRWASFILQKYKPEVIAVTGSVGKTSTQKAIVAVLSQGYGGTPAVFENDNYNDLYGLPIALGRLSATHEKAVLEMASDSFGEIAELCGLTAPRIGVVTNVAESHLQYLGSLDNLAEEYGQLVAALPDDGVAILNGDDVRVSALRGKTEARVISYGRSPESDLWARDVVAGTEGIQFEFHWGEQVQRVRLPLLGEHSVYTALAAIAVGLSCGYVLEEIIPSLAQLTPLPGRLNPLKGLQGTILLDDTFSASPPSALAALRTLSTFPGRRIFVCGDMLGLGSFMEEGHQLVGRRAVEMADYLVTKGDRAELIAQGARRAGMAPHQVAITYTPDDVLKSLVPRLQSGDVVLVKGSEEARMEKVVEGLLADKNEAPFVLVRQDPGWRQKVSLCQERPTWVEIDLGAIAYNLQRIKALVGSSVEVMAVLKADAYGHGILRVARTALLNGASLLGTACLSEAVGLRERGITAPILILGYTPPWQAREVVRYDLRAAVFSLDVARHLSRAAVSQKRPALVHIKVDTGMARLGLAPTEVLSFAEQVRELPNIQIEGIFTHFAKADVRDDPYTLYQLAQFEKVLRQLADRGIVVRYVHAANSAAILTRPQSHFNLVRLGIAMYGLDPSSEVRCPPDFKRALSFKTQVAQVKHLPAGSCISYGCTYVTTRPSVIAVLPVGYGDGFRRAPNHWGEVLVRGQRAPIVGTVCMDMCMIDVTDIPNVRQGDEVVLIGEQGHESITVEEVARRLGTINYEVVSEILARVPREITTRATPG